MLDMAYQDKEEYTGVVTDDNNKDVTYTYEKTCSDDGYLKEQDEQSNWVINVEKEYAGYFEKTLGINGKGMMSGRLAQIMAPVP